MRLRPVGRQLFDLLHDAARNLVEAAQASAELFDRFPEAGDRIERLQQAEAAGDRITAALHERIARMLVTPVDAEDLLLVATALDTVCDEIEEAGSLLELLRLDAVPELARAQARLVLLACERLADATERLWRLPDLHAELGDVYEIEDEGDRIRRDALARIFASGQGPVQVVRLKTLHDALERALDACEEAARTIEQLVLKNR